MALSLPRLDWFKRPRKEKAVANEDGEVISHIDENGREVLDGTPLSPPVGYMRQPSLAEQIRNSVRDYKLMQKLAGDDDIETFEEADDFDVDDDVPVNSPWEETFDSDGNSNFEPIAEVNKKEAAKNAAVKAKSTPPQPAPQAPTEPAQGDKKDPEGGK